MLKRIEFNNYLKEIVRFNKKFPKRINLIGGDTETIKGKPYTLQLMNDKKSELFFVNENNITETFINYVKENYDNRAFNVYFFHNLSFDLPIIFYGIMDRFLKNEFDYISLYDKYYIKVFCGKVYYANLFLLKEKKKSKLIKILDSASFIRKSLGSIAEELNFDNKKMNSPNRLGEIKLTDDYFKEYAINDAVVENELGKYLTEIHREYDIPLTVSIAQLAQYIFRRKFMRDYKIKCPYAEIREASELSFHGGKNGFYLDKPCMIKDVYEIDVNSMYPYAMSELPNFVGGKYRKVYDLEQNYEGIYKVSGFLHKCKYPIIPKHDFSYDFGFIKNIWVTSYELKEALRLKEIDIRDIEGYIYIENKRIKYNPIKEYVTYFYKLKCNTSPNNSKYLIIKLLLNSLYGKFIQNTEEETTDYKYNDYKNDIEPVIKTFRAGGLYNPFIATLITGYARAYLHKLEHQFNALDSSTDSIKTIMNPETVINSEMGGLSIKTYGDCIFFRNKLYIHYGKDKTRYALHGFHGKLEDLERIWKTKDTRYTIKHMNKIKESFRQGLIPFTMEEYNRKLHIDL